MSFPSFDVGKCKNCTGPIKMEEVTKQLFHAETGMTNCPFSNDKAEITPKTD